MLRCKSEIRASKQGKEAGNLKQGVTNIASDNAYVISKGIKALIIFSVDYVLKFVDDNVGANGEEDHGQGTTLSDTWKDVGAIECFPNNLNKVKVVPV